MSRWNAYLRSLVTATLAFSALGCQDDPNRGATEARSFPGVTLTVASAGDPASLAAVRAWKTTWERETGATVNFAADASDPAAADVVVFPGDLMGALVDARVLTRFTEKEVRPPVPLGKEAPLPDPLAFADVLPAFREQVSQYGDERLAMPLGGSGLVLIYRRDLVEDEATKLAANEKGITLGGPKTWDELDALIAFLHERTGKGIAAPLGADPEGVGDALLIARATSSALHPDHYAVLFDPDTLDPRIASPPFIEALTGIAKWKAFVPPKGETFDAEAARAAFRAGDAAFLIDRAERASRWTDPKKPLSVIVSALPSSVRVYEPNRKAWQDLPAPNKVGYLPRGGGLLVGITLKGSEANRKAALDFVRTLAGPETARQLLIEPSYPVLPVRTTQLGLGLPDPRSTLGVDSQSWSKSVAQTLTSPRISTGLRIPGTDLYMEALTKARQAAIAGVPVESALAEAATEWGAISIRLGLGRQLWHYRRSLNTLITEPEPPSADAR